MNKPAWCHKPCSFRFAPDGCAAVSKRSQV
nr:MAG TPA: hypothetical protein [Caudoviricetes sp.]